MSNILPNRRVKNRPHPWRRSYTNLIKLKKNTNHPSEILVNYVSFIPSLPLSLVLYFPLSLPSSHNIHIHTCTHVQYMWLTAGAGVWLYTVHNVWVTDQCINNLTSPLVPHKYSSTITSTHYEIITPEGSLLYLLKIQIK